MTAPDTSKLFGPLLLTIGLTVAITGLCDIGVYLTWGMQATLSQNICDATTLDPAFLAFVGGSCFSMGMLATHFTNFRMNRTDGNHR
ncbi:MAG: hypothetical protein E6R03_03465 [Hyphomicrobiaceae bacterium]|nr:MAG: hypothetical protein E6R03_03465 [Hyphomicrobiaceae bacterium]